MKNVESLNNDVNFTMTSLLFFSSLFFFWFIYFFQIYIFPDLTIGGREVQSETGEEIFIEFVFILFGIYY